MSLFNFTGMEDTVKEMEQALDAKEGCRVSWGHQLWHQLGLLWDKGGMPGSVGSPVACSGVKEGCWVSGPTGEVAIQHRK